MSDDLQIARLRDALAKGGDDRGGEGASAEEILAALKGNATPAEVEHLVERALENGETEELVRLLPGIERAVDEALAVEAPPRRRRWLIGGLAAATFVIGALLIPPMLDRPPSAPAEYRMSGAPRLESALARGAELEREAFTLAWSAGPEGSLYTLTVASADLSVLHEASMLEETEYTVPADALDGLASGDTVLWRVVVTLPDASEVSSGTFRVNIR